VAWVKVPPENHPIFEAALPEDPRVETVKMFGGLAAKVNGRIFAGLLRRSAPSTGAGSKKPSKKKMR
jgi:hypothetical protein